MAGHSEDDLWDMDDDALEAAFKEAQAQETSPETAVETEELDESTSDDNENEEEFEESANLDEDADSDEEDEENGSEQPEGDTTDSDHDSSTDSDDDVVDEDNTEETEETTPDGESETEEAESSDDTTETKDDGQPAQQYKFRANGKDYEFSSEEIVDQFPKVFGKAMDYTKKMQAIKPWRKTIDAIEGAKISHDDVSLMIDVLKGDKDAINEVLKRTGTDTLELNTEEDSNYTAKNYGRDESALAIADVVSTIDQDPEYAVTHNILSKEWDEKSWETMAESPDMIRLLHEDVKSGMYKILQPAAEKLKVFGSGAKSDLEYYKAAAQQYFEKVNAQKVVTDSQANTQAEEKAAAQRAADENAERVAKAKEQSDKRKATKAASVKRKAAATTKNASADRVVDYLDESDEKFDEWYSKLQDSM